MIREEGVEGGGRGKETIGDDVDEVLYIPPCLPRPAHSSHSSHSPAPLPSAVDTNYKIQMKQRHCNQFKLMMIMKLNPNRNCDDDDIYLLAWTLNVILS